MILLEPIPFIRVSCLAQRKLRNLGRVAFAHHRSFGPDQQGNDAHRYNLAAFPPVF